MPKKDEFAAHSKKWPTQAAAVDAMVAAIESAPVQTIQGRLSAAVAQHIHTILSQASLAAGLDPLVQVESLVSGVNALNDGVQLLKRAVVEGITS